MDGRPKLDVCITEKTFREHYYLKSELVDFCRKNNLPTSGCKAELSDRVADYLNSKKITPPSKKRAASAIVGEITEQTAIEQNVVCSQKHREFFRAKIGKSFSFNVQFQNWLKQNAGKTYGEAIAAYRLIAERCKTQKTTIGRQFEYNAYIRDFFLDNSGKTLQDAIKCWKHKKSLAGANCYERADLVALETD